MSRHRPSSLAQIYCILINPRPHRRKAVVCVASSNWTSKRMSTQLFSAFSALETSIRRSNSSSLPFHVPISIRQSSNTIINRNDDTKQTNQTNEEKGEECYQLATEALRNASRAKRKREERLLQEQYDAMDAQRKRTRQREQRRKGERLNDAMDANGKEGLRDRAAGVAVVRTIVKQSQPKDVRVERSRGRNSNASYLDETGNAKVKGRIDDEERWQEVAKKHMEEAAFRHGYCLALVRLGNEALDRAKDDSSSPASSGPLIDRDRCMEWIDESPVDLATILELVANVKGDSDEQAGSGFQKEESVSPYLQLALHLYEEGGKRGSAEGWYNLGHLLWDGANQYATIERAMHAFHKSMKLGDADAMYFVASQYLSHEESEEESGGDASLLLNTLNRYGPAFLSSLQPETRWERLEMMHSLADDLQQHGYELLHIAAHVHGHCPAMHHMALLHMQNDNVEEFRRLLSKAAAAGHPDSLFMRGHCRYSGTDGHDRDVRAALEDFLAAADGGHIDAMVSAGAVLHQGVVGEDGRLIVERDQQRAFDLYQQAGELGSVEGWRNVVSCYATGQGVPKCLETARYIANTMLKEDDNDDK